MPDSYSPKILIIDDVSTMRELYTRYLKRDGFVAVEAESGEEAIQLAKKTNFSGILLDLNMPGIHGIETCRRIRAIRRHKFTPILIVTSEDKTSSYIEAFEAGCDDFITKPVNSVVLCGRLKAHVQRAELYRKNEGMHEVLRRYISPETQRMLDKYSGMGKTPPPEKRELCILITDMRGVRQLAQEVDSEELFQSLGAHLSQQAELVYQHGGYVDKYAGDGITAIFAGEDMERQSCLCAQAIIAFGQEVILKKRSHLFVVSCGLSKGSVVIGNIGSADHLDYTVIGEPVNLAARLSDCSSPTSIVVAENIQAVASKDANLMFIPRDDILIKGFREPANFYELTPSVHS